MLTGATSLDTTNWPQHLTRLSLPRFRAESTFNLIPPLKAMGLQRVFIAGQAGLTGISPADDLHVTTVAQKAFIEVVEAGAEAAAASGIVGGSTSVPQFTRTLVFDRPFFAIIRERTTGSILFISRIVRPEDPPEGETPKWEEQLRATLGNDMHAKGDWMETAIGSLRGQLFPWVDHRQFGWINLWGTYPLLWLWLPESGWLWTDLEQGFPSVYDTRREVWLRLYPDDSVHPWLFNYDTQVWELSGATPEP